MSDNLADVKGEARPGSTQLQTHAEQSMPAAASPSLRNTRALHTAPAGTPGLELDFLVPLCPCNTLF